MTIGINGNEANVKVRVGSGQYAYELLTHLKSSDSYRVYLESKPLDDMPKNFSYEVFGPKKLWTLTGLQKRLIEEKTKGTLPDVFFTPGHYAPLYMPTKSVISIMDLAFEKFKEYYKKQDLYQLKYWTMTSAMGASKILTISEHSKKDICSLYAVSPDKVVVTYPGYDKDRFSPKVKPGKFKGKYFVFLGTLQPKKNIERLVEAFSRIEDDSIKLVIVGMINEGRGGWMNQSIFDKVKDLRLEDRVIFTGYVPDNEVPGIFKGALAYVLPSLYEGFGIPPIEAMATGVPVVVSKVSSLPEICGEAAIYIENPYDIDSIKRGLDHVLKMTKTEREKRVDLGEKWVKRYNWEDTAKKTLEVLKNV